MLHTMHIGIVCREIVIDSGIVFGKAKEVIVMVYCVFFFFQAEDGIRDLTVTGVQTCALPISERREWQAFLSLLVGQAGKVPAAGQSKFDDLRARLEAASVTMIHLEPEHEGQRSEERRVGKECRSRWAADH